MEENNRRRSITLVPLAQSAGVAVEFRDDHVLVQLARDLVVSSEQRNVLWERIARVCEENRTRRVLVAGRAPEGVLQSSEVIDAGLKAATVPKLWMALCFKDFVPDELSELYETVAAARGVRVKHFTNTDAAMQWLRKNAPA